LILGTTDTLQTQVLREPQAAQAEVDFILDESANYLTRAPKRSDVLSCWAGLRPLVQDTSASSTKTISREHTIEVAANGLLTVTGGKWTTYRSMAEDVLAHAVAAKLIPVGLGDCQTTTLRLLGADSPCNSAVAFSDLATGEMSDFVYFAMHHEFARTTTDVLARRSRMLFLDAERARGLSQGVSNKLIHFGCINSQKYAFDRLAAQYTCSKVLE
jgi:glycerol-3-phosphate dehydrogenase